MKYTIFTVVNDVYLDFLYYFVKSALEKCTNMSELVILYTGETFKNDPIYNHEKIKIIKHNEVIKTKDIWDDGWLKNVDLKTKYLRDLSIHADNPIFLIDVDCYFLSEFIDLVDLNKDILVTKRNHPSPYIASFVGLIKPKSCIEFLDVWRDKMSKIPSAPKETNALINTIPVMASKVSIQELLDTTINCVNIQSPPSEARILHFKGNRIGDATELLTQRFNKLKNII